MSYTPTPETRSDYIARMISSEGMNVGEAMASAKRAGFQCRHDQVELLLSAVLAAQAALTYCGKVPVGRALNARAIAAIDAALDAVRGYPTQARDGEPQI